MGNRFTRWLQSFMIGRYGPDEFSQFLTMTALVLMILGIFVPILSTLSLAALVYAMIRILSRNGARRTEENAAYLRIFGQVKRWFLLQKNRFTHRKTHRYLACPSCRQSLRVPKGQGEINITCPKCQNQFSGKS